MTTVADINAACAEIARKAQPTGERFTAWAKWDDGTHCTEPGLLGPEANRQMIAWRRQGARVGYGVQA